MLGSRFPDATNFVDLETGTKMPIIPEYLREQYREVVKEHVTQLGSSLGGQGVDYALFDTSRPMDELTDAAMALFIGERP